MKIDGQYKWLVTGGAGFIGSHLVEALRALGQNVRVMDHAGDSRDDIRDREACFNLAECCDYIIHLAAISTIEDIGDASLDYHETNVVGFQNVIAAAKWTGVRRFVYASSAAVYATRLSGKWEEDALPLPTTYYGLSKLANEITAEAYNCHVQSMGLRYFNVYGPRQHSNVIAKWKRAVDKGETPILHGCGKTVRDFIHVDDVVQATIRAAITPMRNRHEIFDIGTGEGTSLYELAKRLGVSPKADELYVDSVSVASIAKARSLLGWEPTITLEEGLKRL